VFYTDQLALAPLFTAAAVYAVLLAFIRFRLFGGYIVYTVLGLFFFTAMLRSGVHTTIAGVLLGLAVPSRPVFLRESFSEKITELAGHFHETHAKRREVMSGPEMSHDDHLEAGEYSNQEQVILGKIDELVRGTESPCSRLRRTVSPFVNYLVLPVFALANAGVVISAQSLAQALEAQPAWGVVAGLLLGKPLGVLSAAWLANKTGLGQFPHGVGWRHVTGMALLSGIGFTVSLFIADLAFRGTPMADEVKMAVMAASFIAAVAGMLYFSLAFNKHKAISQA
jgi:NhaA family Na+:H+ antiporter